MGSAYPRWIHGIYLNSHTDERKAGVTDIKNLFGFRTEELLPIGSKGRNHIPSTTLADYR